MRKISLLILNFCLGIVAGNLTAVNCLKKRIINREKDVYKFKAYYDMLRKWIEVEQEGKSIEELLLKKGYTNIAIYGMGDVGNLLFADLKNTSINVLYGIDKNIIGNSLELEIVKPQENLKKVDAIIVSAVFAYDEIADMLRPLVDCPVIAMDDLIYEIV